MELSEAIPVLTDPQIESRNGDEHQHSDAKLGFVDSTSPDPDPAPSDPDHVLVVEELQQLDLKVEVEEVDDELQQKLDWKVEEVGDELQKLDWKVEEVGDELQKLDLKSEEDGGGKLEDEGGAWEGEEVGDELQKLDLQAKEDGGGEWEVEKRSDGGESGEGNDNWGQSYQGRGGGGESKSDYGGGDVEKTAENWSQSYQYYPVRPEAEDCSFYLRTGSCKFGSNCKFNHPVKRKSNQVPKDRVKESEEVAENSGQTECKYYLRSGGCKYGKACRYSHSKGKPSVALVMGTNFAGLPIRPGERECPFYMRHGECKYASNCRFSHPDPVSEGGSDPSSGYDSGGPALQAAAESAVAPWSAPRSLNETQPYMPRMIPLSQGVPSQSIEWNGYQAPAYLSEGSMPVCPPYVMNNSLTESNIYKQYPHQNQAEEFPERPGQPFCSYYLRTGDCKFKSSCKYHHPKTQTAVSPSFTFSDMGLPLRPDQNICTHYSRYGICKYGPACKFDHPLHITSSTTSGPDHQLPFSNPAATTNRAAPAGSRGETDAAPMLPLPV